MWGSKTYILLHVEKCSVLFWLRLFCWFCRRRFLSTDVEIAGEDNHSTGSQKGKTSGKTSACSGTCRSATRGTWSATSGSYKGVLTGVLGVRSPLLGVDLLEDKISSLVFLM